MTDDILATVELLVEQLQLATQVAEVARRKLAALYPSEETPDGRG